MQKHSSTGLFYWFTSCFSFCLSSYGGKSSMEWMFLVITEIEWQRQLSDCIIFYSPRARAVKLVSSFVSMLFIIFNASSSLLILVAGLSNGIPALWYSKSKSPAPIPSSNLPFDIRWRDAAAFASITGYL